MSIFRRSSKTKTASTAVPLPPNDSIDDQDVPDAEVVESETPSPSDNPHIIADYQSASDNNQAEITTEDAPDAEIVRDVGYNRGHRVATIHGKGGFDAWNDNGGLNNNDDGAGDDVFQDLPESKPADQLADQVDDQLADQVDDQLADQVDDQLADQVADQVDDQSSLYWANEARRNAENAESDREVAAREREHTQSERESASASALKLEAQCAAAEEDRRRLSDERTRMNEERQLLENQRRDLEREIRDIVDIREALEYDRGQTNQARDSLNELQEELRNQLSDANEADSLAARLVLDETLASELSAAEEDRKEASDLLAEVTAKNIAADERAGDLAVRLADIETRNSTLEASEDKISERLSDAKKSRKNSKEMHEEARNLRDSCKQLRDELDQLRLGALEEKALLEEERIGARNASAQAASIQSEAEERLETIRAREEEVLSLQSELSKERVEMTKNLDEEGRKARSLQEDLAYQIEAGREKASQVQSEGEALRAQLEQRIITLDEQIADQAEAESGAQVELEEARKNIESLRNSLMSERQDLATAKGNFNNERELFQRTSERADHDLGLRQKELDSLFAEAAEAKASSERSREEADLRSRHLEEESNLLRSRIADMEKTLVERKDQIEVSDQALKIAAGEKERLEREVRRVRDSNEDALAEQKDQISSTFSEQIADLQEQFQTASKAVGETASLHDRIAELESELNSKSSEDNSAMAKALLEEVGAELASLAGSSDAASLAQLQVTLADLMMVANDDPKMVPAQIERARALAEVLRSSLNS